ncbi:hypothetical protein DERP_001916 [Dermatophagoides pteronyssinus]|uniref:Uncharacterized protein LOC113790829 n=2 Tax=Dermatophagoides pteronyssinus TaxID=6956 RepID=A0A6P6XS98_DERPT|nr:uncharacterized protein LOC113790829 [Dermatophagoides pteronyssinus]KAH9420081.1 hypothetical protein DERP_001916 [Dermatophagoides pteronyssinus]
MAQGKLKVKTKLPGNVKKASVHRGVQKKKSKVPNKKSKPINPGQKLQHEVTKEINKTIEAEARGMAQKFGEPSAKIDRKSLKS